MATETEFYISGLSCDGCVKKTREALSHVTGYQDAQIDLEQGTMTVTGEIDPQAVSVAMAEIGYGAVVKSA